MKRAVIVFIHCGYWLIYLLLLSVILAIAGMQVRKSPLVLPPLFPLLVLCVAPNFISFYSFYFLLFSRFLVRRKIFALVIFGALVCLISALSGAFISPVFFGFEQVIFSDAREFVSLTVSFFVIAAIHGVIALVIRGFITWYDEIKLKEELAQKNFETELALIKSQINPHFLFNTINNIDVLIGKDPAQASEYLNKLSGMLRYLLYETKTEKISLDEELKYIEKYIELQRIRTRNRNYLLYEVTGEAGNQQIAPMIFLPFIENAFKHTENNKTRNSINIEIAITKQRLKFECKNTYQNDSDSKHDFGGLGNELIARRLTLLYPDKHSLEFAVNEGIYRVELSLDL